MILLPFEYHAPSTLEEALDLLASFGSVAKVLAGGQSLIPLMKMNLVDITHIVDIKGIKELSFIRSDTDSGGREALVVGALARYSDLERSEAVRRAVPLLADTAAGIGHAMVRNRGTLGGSISHCDPAADLCTTALALGARMNISSARGRKRTVDAADFFVGPLTTCMEEGEILESVTFPAAHGQTGHSVMKFTLGQGDFPLLVVSSLVRVEGGRIVEASAALGGVSGTPIRVHGAEQELLSAGRVTREDVSRIALRTAESIDMEEDTRVSGSYKKRLVASYLGRSLAEAIGMAGGTS